MSGPKPDRHSIDRAAQVKKAAPGRLTSALQMWISGAGPKAFIKLLENRMRVGQLTLILPDGKERIIKAPNPGACANLHIHNWRVAKRLLTSGGVGFAQSYIDEDWDSSDLATLIELAAQNRNYLGNTVRGRGFSKALLRFQHLLRANTRSNAKRNIAFHYDLGNSFYKPWLDDTMTYSSALFTGGENSLESAQLHKYRRLLDLLDVSPGQHILEIGCGWGGFAEIAAKERGAKVTGITLSNEQLKFAQDRIEKAGLSDKVEFKLIDYRDMKGHFDHVASIEMFEAVGEKYWPGYFRKIHGLLKPNGRAAIQFITIEDAVYDAYRRSADFIQTYIFPGGMLPTARIFQDMAKTTGLDTLNSKAFGQHYAQTLNQWRERFNKAFDAGQLPEGFDDTFKRIWNYYLAYCEGGFRAGGIDVMQVALERR